MKDLIKTLNTHAFKGFCPKMLDLFDEIIADSCLTFTTFRVAMLYLWNLGCIQRTTVKNYLR